MTADNLSRSIIYVDIGDEELDANIVRALTALLKQRPKG